MIDYFDVIKSRSGVPVDDYWAMIWAQGMTGEKWQITTLTGTLPLTFEAKGEALKNYRLYGSSEGAGVQTSGTEPAGYKIPLTVTSGEQSDTYPVYIGDTKLYEDEYVDYGEQKVYKLKEVHKDTVTINGIEWDILGYDHDEVYKADGVTRAQHTVTIQAHDCITNLQFDAREVLFAFPNGLTAGAYKFTVGTQPWYVSDVNKVVTFTLTQAIPNNGVLVLTNGYNATMIGTSIKSYASLTATTEIEAVTLTEADAETVATDLGTVANAISQDGNTNSIQRALLGSNNWKQSALRQYLNSSAAAGSVWAPQTKFDRPPSWAATTAGFLKGIDPEFLSVLGFVKKTTALNTVTDGGGTEITSEKVFLLSSTEAYFGGSEGTAYPYYSDFSDNGSASTGADTNRIKYRNGTAKYWWLRSPYPGSATTVRYVSPSGVLNTNYATNSYGVAPACCIILDDINTNPYLQSLFLKPTDPPASFPAILTYKGENSLDSTETVEEVSVTGKIKEASQ